MSSRRLKAWQRGRNAERIAAWSLRARGYRILASRYRTPSGEIDLIARRAGTLVFVEVKARATPGAGLEAISLRQQRRIRAAAETFLARGYGPTRCRFDAIVITPGPFGLPRITHRKNAWT